MIRFCMEHEKCVKSINDCYHYSALPSTKLHVSQCLPQAAIYIIAIATAQTKLGSIYLLAISVRQSTLCSQKASYSIMLDGSERLIFTRNAVYRHRLPCQQCTISFARSILCLYVFLVIVMH